MTYPPQHPGEDVSTDSGTESLSIEIDPSSPNRVMVSAFEDEEYRVGLYLTPEDAHTFADALHVFAQAASGWPPEQYSSPREALDELISDLEAHQERWESQPAEYRTASGSWVDTIDTVRAIRSLM